MLIFGEVLVDLFASAPERPQTGVRRFPFLGVPGGAPCNVAAFLAHLGVPVSFMASFADDPTGEALRQMLAERGIDLTWSVTHPGSRTPMAMVLTKPDGDRTFRLYLDGSAVEHLTTDMVDPASLSQVAWFHFGSVMMAFANPNRVTHLLLQQARDRGVMVSYDVNVRPDIWRDSVMSPRAMVDVLRFVDVVKLSDEDFDWIRAHVAPTLQAPRQLLDLGCRLVVCTHGKDGATLFTREAVVKVPAPQVEVVDTTGAGDAFMAGVISRLCQAGIGRPSDLDWRLTPALLQEAGNFAAACAGRILVQRGAMPA